MGGPGTRLASLAHPFSLCAKLTNPFTLLLHVCTSSFMAGPHHSAVCDQSSGLMARGLQVAAERARHKAAEQSTWAANENLKRHKEQQRQLDLQHDERIKGAPLLPQAHLSTVSEEHLPQMWSTMVQSQDLRL